MARLNEAYRVLSDPARRAAYDASLRAAATGPTGSAAGPTVRVTPPAAVRRPTTPAATTPVRFPWRLSLVMAAIGAVAVFTIAAMATDAPAPAPDGRLELGSCVTLVERDNAAFEVNCDDNAVYRVHSLVPLGRGCPAGTSGYRDVKGVGTACIEVIDSD